MSRVETICENSTFKTLYYRGKSQVSPLLVTYVRKNRCGHVRIGITTGTKIGGAVVRSRARRVIREAFYRLDPTVVGGWDIVFVARSRTAHSKSTEVGAVMQQHLTDLGVITP